MKEITCRQPHRCHNDHFTYLYFKLIGDEIKNRIWSTTCNCSTFKLGEGYSPCGETELYIGENDKNSCLIFENDIVKVPEGYGGDNFYKEYLGIVCYKNCEFYIKALKEEDEYKSQDFQWNELEVINNKHQYMK